MSKENENNFDEKQPEKSVAKIKHNLPTLVEIFGETREDLEIAYKREGLNFILNQEPRKDWIKIHPTISGWKYIPIEKVEFLLSKIFTVFSIEVIETKMMMNAVTVTVRVHYYDPITKIMRYNDGVGGCEVQTKKDTGSLKMDMSNINRGAISMALPIAKSLAIKDATDHLGKLFGRDLNRKDVIPFTVNSNIVDKFNKIMEEE